MIPLEKSYSIQKVMSEKSAIEKLLNPNSKGRQAQHFQRFCFSRNMIYTIKKTEKH